MARCSCSAATQAGSPIPTPASFVIAVVAGSLFVMLVGVVNRARHHPAILFAAARRPVARHLRPRIVIVETVAVLFRQPVENDAATGGFWSASRRSAS